MDNEKTPHYNSHLQVKLSDDKNTRNNKVIVVLAVLLLLAIIGVAVIYTVQQDKISELRQSLSDTQKFAKSSNQACAGLNKTDKVASPSLSNIVTAQELLKNDVDGKVAIFTCNIGQNTQTATKGMEVAKVDSEGREMGAEVIHFNSEERAIAYHEKVINPLRYWSVPNESLNENIPTFKYFTSYVFGTPTYYDAYAVSGKVIIRLTLPCANDKEDQNGINLCMGESVDEGEAIEKLRSFAESVESI